MSKHVSLRKCLGCGRSFPKRELIRIARQSSGEISLDLTGKTPGRGFYLCPSDRCLDQAVKMKSFERVLLLGSKDPLILEVRREIKIRQETRPWVSE